jgi:hypothetical protein
MLASMQRLATRGSDVLNIVVAAAPHRIGRAKQHLYNAKPASANFDAPPKSKTRPTAPLHCCLRAYLCENLDVFCMKIGTWWIFT